MSQASSLFSYRHQEALQQEVTLLQSLLKRNRCSHQRTKYYQRLSMALKAIQRHCVLQIFQDISSLLETLKTTRQQMKQERSHEKIFWSKEENGKKQPFDSIDTHTKLDTLWQTSELLGQYRVLQGIPECLSRLEYASRSLFTEIVRGFFLPLCTVALACVARTRSLLLRLSHYVLLECLPVIRDGWNGIRSAAEVATVWGCGETQEARQRYLYLVSLRVDPSSASHNSNTVTREQRTRAVLKQLGLSKTWAVEQQNDRSEQDGRLEPDSSVGATEHRADNDVGESLHAAKEVPSPALRLCGAVSADGVDRNAEAVQILKDKKKRKSKGKSSTKSKKKKSRKSGDFFDELFS